MHSSPPVPRHVERIRKIPRFCGAIRTGILEEIVRVTDLATFKADSLTEEQVSEYKEAFSLFVSCANGDSLTTPLRISHN